MFRIIFLGAALLVVEVKANLQILPEPTTCNIYERNLVWVLEDCICRPIQNPCLMEQENSLRLSSRKTPLVPVSEELCKHFIPKKCLIGLPVIAQFPKPPKCGCKGKPGTITEKKFKNVCEMKKYSAKYKEAYTSYKFTLGTR
ncbi:salivary glue protein Sgs-5 [Drosophila innubila]|uniref:salivary glue protein Sgs-5 n=1 Tax=Drosophila innubila TaxID=198719 RepID=UPI00148C01D4|nr:salivary glue protein Sgs-5 [Drosophila innubila]